MFAFIKNNFVKTILEWYDSFVLNDIFTLNIVKVV